MDHSDKNATVHPYQLDGEFIAELLDQDEYPSNIGNVVAVSDQQICVLRRDWHELSHCRLEYLDMNDCRSIEYQSKAVYYRIVVGVAFFALAAFLIFTIAGSLPSLSPEEAPLVVALIGSVTFGIRFITSTHWHVIRFEMPDEVVAWRSPAIDYEAKVEAVAAVCDFARKRGILQGNGR